MLISGQDSGLMFETDKRLVNTLETARAALGVTKDVWASKYLKISQKKYQFILSRRSTLTLLSLYRLSEQLDMNLSDFDENTFDFDTLAFAQKNPDCSIHPKYTFAANSRKHSAINVMRFAEKYRGSHITHTINRHFQIKGSFWRGRMTDSINIRFMTELYSYLRNNLGFSENDLQAIGHHQVVNLRETPMGKQLSQLRSTQSVLEQAYMTLLRDFEQNCDYQLMKLDHEQCILESKTKPEISEAFGVHEVGNPHVCTGRSGLFAGLPGFIGMPLANIQETRCVHRGDPVCRFVFDYSSHRVRDTGVRLSVVSH
ncbi:hypothetical protein WDW37_07890 [Bdellovibrionota bacterium FG-1]